MSAAPGKRLQGKVAIITGAARGIGEATARLFAAEGARLVLVDQRAEQGAALAQALGECAVFVAADVSLESDWQRIVDAAHAHFGPVTVLVNNAALLSITPLMDTRRELLERLFAVNQLGPLLGIQAVVPDMRAEGVGSIINIGSSDAISAQDIGLVAYGATKWALRGITRMAAMELGRHGIRVNCVHPDGGNPAMSAPFLPEGTDPEQAMNTHLHQILQPPRGRAPGDRMRDVAYMNVFLASDESAACTAGDYPVDGGYTAGRCINRHPQ